MIEGRPPNEETHPNSNCCNPAFNLAIEGALGEMPEVEDLSLAPSKYEGKLDAGVWSPVRGAASYQIQISVDPVTLTNWVLFDSCNTAR